MNYILSVLFEGETNDLYYKGSSYRTKNLLDKVEIRDSLIRIEFPRSKRINEKEFLYTTRSYIRF